MLSPRASTAMPTRLYFGVHRLLTIIAFSVMGRAPRSVVVAPRDLPFEQRLEMAEARVGSSARRRRAR